MKNQISFYEISQPKNSPEADPCSQKNDSRASALRAPQTLHQEEGQKNCIVYKKKRGGKGQKEEMKLKSRFFWRMILLLLVHLSIEFAIGIN
ncbi:hypothetical protein MTR67_013701 [Solanum verrucosum]|uniref:Uncharacterized protein n=1 Tax=Solanum verrucosum TaxID=315347 RepID=A0AAF0TI59_SOLVR|nr:hypothetical protein MTR67_013701 [Solanum verrucosum]